MLDQELQGLLEDQQQLEELLPALQEALVEVPAQLLATVPFSDLQGKLNWPVVGPLLATFGSSRMQGAMRWKGVLIGVQSGSEVPAIAAGRIVFADSLRGFGLLLIIDHGDGYLSLYGHNQSMEKRTGDWVNAAAVRQCRKC